jgi:hypothetical protein
MARTSANYIGPFSTNSLISMKQGIQKLLRKKIISKVLTKAKNRLCLCYLDIVLDIIQWFLSMKLVSSRILRNSMRNKFSYFAKLPGRFVKFHFEAKKACFACFVTNFFEILPSIKYLHNMMNRPYEELSLQNWKLSWRCRIPVPILESQKFSVDKRRLMIASLLSKSSIHKNRSL